jgi:hypothetical protein
MIIHYTKYAEEKFFILQNHGRQILKEDITEIVKIPDGANEKKGFVFAHACLPPDNYCWEVVYKKEDGVLRIITFYPIKFKEEV